MYSSERTRSREPTLGFLELCTNLQHLSISFDIDEYSPQIGYDIRVLASQEAEKLSRKWMLFFDLQSLTKATALQTLEISFDIPFRHEPDRLTDDRIIEHIIKQISEILPSWVQIICNKRRIISSRCHRRLKSLDSRIVDI